MSEILHGNWLPGVPWDAHLTRSVFSSLIAYATSGHTQLWETSGQMEVGDSELSRINEIGCYQPPGSLSVYFFLI